MADPVAQQCRQELRSFLTLNSAQLVISPLHLAFSPNAHGCLQVASMFICSGRNSLLLLLTIMKFIAQKAEESFMCLIDPNWFRPAISLIGFPGKGVGIAITGLG